MEQRRPTQKNHDGNGNNNRDFNPFFRGDSYQKRLFLAMRQKYSETGRCTPNIKVNDVLK